MRKRLLCFVMALILLLSLCPMAHAEDMQYSEDLVTFIKNGEGFRAMPYGGSGGWFIGYGCACDPADYPDGITEEGADALLRSKMDGFADSVRSFLQKYGVTVAQRQFDAMCAMTYALGPAWLNASNTLPGYIINGASNYTHQQIATAFAMWCHVGSVVNTAALQRRIMEAKIFLLGDYSLTTDGWYWLLLDANGGKNAKSDVAVYPAGVAYSVLPEVSNTGSVFVGWQKPDGTMLSPSDTAQENLSLTAVWRSAAAVQSTAAAEEPSAEETSAGSGNCVFPDVLREAAWCAEYVNTLVSRGVVHGYPDGTFRPNNSVTWGEALTLILLASGYSTQTAPEGSHWAQGYLDFALKKGFLAAGAVTNLDNAANRNAIADLCAAALGLSAPSGMTSPFADTNRGSVLALYNVGILSGSFDANGNRMYYGKDVLRRSEICSILIHVTDYVGENVIVFNNNRLSIDTTLNLCSYDPDCFYTKNGRTYYDDGTTAVRYGIDVSYYQGDIDWAAVAADGIDFAIIRCGYRGYSSGEIHEDSKFRDYVAGATAAGLDVGVYFFSQATTVAEALEEAEFTLSQIRGYKITFPVVFDWEQVTTTGSRTRSFSGKTLTDCTVAFCDAVKAAGYTPMTYFNKTLGYLKLDLHQTQKYAGWYAYYHERPDFVYDFQMWQYGSSGKVAGISGRADMNIAFTNFK